MYRSYTKNAFHTTAQSFFCSYCSHSCLPEQLDVDDRVQDDCGCCKVSKHRLKQLYTEPTDLTRKHTPLTGTNIETPISHIDMNLFRNKKQHLL